MAKDFKGVVFSGIGEGEIFVSLYAKNIKAKLNINPYPGTLNIKILNNIDEFNAALSRLNPIVIEPPEIPGTKLGRVLAYPAVLNYTVNVFIVRPEITVYKRNVAEVIAEVRLRDELNLSDGSEVTISLPD